MTASPLHELSSWDPIDLGPILAGNYTGPLPSMLQRSDGACLVYPGKVHSIAGEPGSGKSWIAQVVTAQALAAGLVVVYVDFEDEASSVVSRLRALGAATDVLGTRFGYISPQEQLHDSRPSQLRPWVDAANLVIIDGVTDAMTLHGWEVKDNRDAASFMQELVRYFTEGALQPAVLLIDHVTKSKDGRGNYALGAQHKMAAVHVQFTVELQEAFDQDQAGSVMLSVTKDRYGQVQRVALPGKRPRPVAVFRFDPHSDGVGMRAQIDEPQPAEGKPVDRAQELEREVFLAVFNAEPEGITKTDIRVSVTGRDSSIDEALARLRDRGFLKPDTDRRGAKWHLGDGIRLWDFVAL